MKLKSIFEAITPQNIKDIPLIRDAMDIFIQNLQDNASVATEIRNIFKPENEEIRENLLKIYLASLYSVISNVQTNKDITNKFTDDEGIVLKKDIKDILNDEYFTSNKEYKQRVGTKLGIDYTYQLARYLQTNEFVESDFELTELQPFHFKSEGTIYRELYENVVKPLSHPLGFTYIYNRLIRNTLVDLFGVKKSYVVNKLEVRCLDGYYDVFTPDTNDVNVKADFLSRINPLTNELFTEAEYNTYVTVYYSKIPDEVEIDTIDGAPHKEVIFTDGTLLEQYTSPIRVYYRNYIDEVLDTSNYIKQYTSHCSMYMDYEEKFVITYTDSIEQFMMQFELSDSDYTVSDEADDNILLLSIFSNVGYYFYTSDGEYLKMLDYHPDEFGDTTETIPALRQIKYIGTSNPTGTTNDYYIYVGASGSIDISSTDFTNTGLWTTIGSEPKNDWYLITQG